MSFHQIAKPIEVAVTTQRSGVGSSTTGLGLLQDDMADCTCGVLLRLPARTVLALLKELFECDRHFFLWEGAHLCPG